MAFLYILVAIYKVSQNFINTSKMYTSFSMEVNPEPSFLQLLRKDSTLFPEHCVKGPAFPSPLGKMPFFS